MFRLTCMESIRNLATNGVPEMDHEVTEIIKCLRSLTAPPQLRAQREGAHLGGSHSARLRGVPQVPLRLQS